MISRLLIWGYGRVGNAMIQGCLQNWSELSDSENHFHELGVISQKARPKSLPSNVTWLNHADVMGSPNTALRQGDVLLLTVTDGLIATISNRCDIPGISIVHCSGATPRMLLEQAASMVFYPLQTFSGESEVDWSAVPVFTEMGGEEDFDVLARVAQLLGVVNTHSIPFSARENLHMAAVFANNFTTAMAGIAHDVLRQKGLQPSWIQPILAQTALNLGANHPWEKLTGPAKRGDELTIQKHLQLLDSHKDWKEIYQIMSGYIQNRTDNDLDVPHMS